MEKNVNKTMPAEKAKKMVKMYRDKDGKHPHAELTTSVWFSVAKLKTMIDAVAADTNLKEPGIRIYFGTYTEKEVVPTINGPKEYIYRNTLIMVPTTQGLDTDGITKINIDYDVQYFIDIENQGELCPEECGGTDRWGMPNL